MARFDDLLLRYREQLAKLVPVDEPRTQELRTKVPGLPQDYLDFLRTVGAGEINSSLMLYDGIEVPERIYDAARAAGLGPLKIFGDDFQGYCFAFDPEGSWKVVEIEPIDGKTDPLFDTFEAFIRDWLEKS